MKNHRLSVTKFQKTALICALVLVVLSMQAAVFLRATNHLFIGDANALHLIHHDHVQQCLDCTHKRSRRHEPATKPHAFGACLMVKDDNELLYEWLAYHYTMLPLGFLVVGSDVGNSQDPREVLDRWKGLNLTTTVLEPDEFINRHGNYNHAFGGKKVFESEKERTSHHHHALIHRQKGFISTCAELLKGKGVGWTLITDTDEFLVLNPMTVEEEGSLKAKNGLARTSAVIQARRMISQALNQNAYFFEVLHSLRELDNTIGGCYTIPRLLVGALENETCPGVEQSATYAKAVVNGRFSQLSTLRFFQHARKGDFALSKFGKVLLDLSSIEDETVRLQVPANIHRPYKQHCRSAGGVKFANSYFFLLHYIGSWERYASRSDDRRNRAEWEMRSNISEDTSACAAKIWRWFPLFARRVGESSAKYLLGGSLLAR